MNPHHKSETELQSELQQVNAAKADPGRFSVLYDKYYKPVFVFIYRRTANEELTADLCSHVFLKALVNIKKYEYRGVPFSAWLFRIAFNEINLYFRKNKSSRVVSLDEGRLRDFAEEAALDDTSAEQARMMQALKQLPDEDIQLIELRFFEKRSFAEVGNITGITENNAKVRVYRIIDKLKKIMQVKK